MPTSLEVLLNNQEVVLADGAMGSLLFSKGLEPGRAPEVMNLEAAEAVHSIHLAYIAAGAQIILTNSFGGSRLRLDSHNLGDRTAELNLAAARVARRAADGARRPVVVAGDIGPCGRLIQPWGDLPYKGAVATFEEQAAALMEAGVDLIWIETMFDLEEVRAAVEGVRQVNPTFPMVTSMTFDAKGRTMMGVTPENAAETLRGYGPLAIGGNCGNGVDEIVTVVEKMHQTDPTLVLVAKANAGLPRLGADGRPEYEGTPADMGDYARRVQAAGARIIGACCGSTPDHIRAIHQAIESSRSIS